MKKFVEIKSCRICKEPNLISILSLGTLHLSGVFPKENSEDITSGPLDLVKCECCGLVQLKQSYLLNEMYGDHYGYRSSLNESMMKHLSGIASRVKKQLSISNEDIILDIGSNDSSLLQNFLDTKAKLVGMDPSGEKLRSYYPSNIQLIPKFFSSDTFINEFGSRKAKLITSIAMFYDLENPIQFMREVYHILSDNGIWIFEQSYMPTMIEKNAYDTICHEHLEYYALKQIKWMTDIVGFNIIDVEFNNINGGSFCVSVAKNKFINENSILINKILKLEEDKGYNSFKPFLKFKNRLIEHKEKLNKLISNLKLEDKKIFGYGASTKGNILLQYCGITINDLPFIAEVNKEKFGSVTPGSNIPIISEKEAKKMNPDYFLILPWHFRDFIVNKELNYLQSGGKLIFPLPTLDIVSK